MHALKRKLCLDTACFWIGIFGFVNSHKRVDKVIEAIADLERRGYPVRLLIVGEVNDARVNLSELLDKHDVHSIVHHQGYIPEAAFLEAMKAMDLIVSLRYPTMGESWASLFDALSLGKPVITSDYGAFSEIPDCVTWKVSVDDFEIGELTSFIEVSETAPIRSGLSRNPIAFVKEKANLAHVAETYLDAILTD